MIVAVSGCGFTTAAPPDYALGDGPKDGLVMMSFTQPPHQRVQWVYRDVTKGKGIWGVNERHVSTGNHPDVSEPIESGDTRPIAATLPQGEYEFFRWRAHEFRLVPPATGTFRSASRRSAAKPFTSEIC